jgi:hypothetical protein
MSLIVNINPVPWKILELVKARILKNRAQKKKQGMNWSTNDVKRAMALQPNPLSKRKKQEPSFMIDNEINLILKDLGPNGMYAWETDNITANMSCEWSTIDNDFTIKLQHDLPFMEERPPYFNETMAIYVAYYYTAASLKNNVYTFVLVSMESVPWTDISQVPYVYKQKFRKAISFATYPSDAEPDQDFIAIMSSSAALSFSYIPNPGAGLQPGATYFDFPTSEDWSIMEADPSLPDQGPFGSIKPKWLSARFENLFAYENYIKHTTYYNNRPQDSADGVF